jgi:hypothetical protein
MEFAMRTRQVVALVIACLLLLPGLGMLVGGGAVSVLELAARDDGGWHSRSIDALASDGVAVTSEGALVHIEGAPAQLRDFDLQFRLSVTPTDSVNPVFVGIAPTADLVQYLQGAGYEVVSRVGPTGAVTSRTVLGSGSVPPPTDQDFWVAQASGPGTQELTWTPSSGEWSMAILNASGASGVSVSAVAGVRSGWLLPVGIGLLVGGLVVTALATVLFIMALRGREGAHVYGQQGYGQPGQPASGQPGQPEYEHTAFAQAAGPPGAYPQPVPGQPPGVYAGAPWRAVPTQERPVVLEARIAPNLSRGLWLVKWFLAIPHFLVLAALWFVFAVATIGAWFAILFTGRYPLSIFDFNVGVLRWSWRVMHYCGTGGLGTDRYPPFSLDPQPGDDARLDIAYPDHLSRGLIFVKWLLLVPHWIIVALIVGNQSHYDENGVQVGGWPGVLGILVFVAGLALLFGGSLPKGIFDVVVGLNRWVYRVIAYGALMTDVYPPFRYDGGGEEPVPGWQPPTGPPVSGAVPDDAPRADATPPEPSAPSQSETPQSVTPQSETPLAETPPADAVRADPLRDVTSTTTGADTAPHDQPDTTHPTHRTPSG